MLRTNPDPQVQSRRQRDDVYGSPDFDVLRNLNAHAYNTRCEQLADVV